MIMICPYQEPQTETYGLFVERIAFGYCAKFDKVICGVHLEIAFFYGPYPAGNQKGPQEHQNHPFLFHVVLLSGPVVFINGFSNVKTAPVYVG